MLTNDYSNINATRQSDWTGLDWAACCCLAESIVKLHEQKMVRAEDIKIVTCFYATGLLHSLPEIRSSPKPIVLCDKWILTRKPGLLVLVFMTQYWAVVC